MTSIPRCHCWHPAPKIAEQYIALISRFGANDNMNAWATDYVRHHAGRLRWDVDFLTENFKFSTCLNIGGAPYLFEHLLTEACRDVRITSIDLDVSRFPFASDVLCIKIVQADIEKVVPSSETFDCIALCEIFEHLRIDIIGTMRRIAMLSADDGILYLTMPNGLGLAALRRIFDGRSGPDVIGEWQKLSSIGHMGHVREYSASEICAVLEFVGFRVERLLSRRLAVHARSLKGHLREFATSTLVRITPWLGDEIVIVARKEPSRAPGNVAVAR
jgi:hypothetical protein